MKYKCPKCDNTTYEIGEMRATGGTWSKIFDVQNKNLRQRPVKNVLILNSLKQRRVL